MRDDRPPTRGARIETAPPRKSAGCRIAPLRGGRGLKHDIWDLHHDYQESPPYAGGAD